MSAFKTIQSRYTLMFVAFIAVIFLLTEEGIRHFITPQLKATEEQLVLGKVNTITNAVLYGICLFLFDVSTVIYSLIYAAVSAFAVDHEHSQNINVEVRIITKLDDTGLEQEILQKMDRGITRLESTGAYTNEKSNMLYILVSKYEVGQLKNIVLKYDPHAFIVMNEGVTVIGHYKKKL